VSNERASAKLLNRTALTKILVQAHFEKLIDRRFDDGGPVLLAAKIDDEPGQGQTPRDPTLIRSRFMKGLGTGRGGALESAG